MLIEFKITKDTTSLVDTDHVEAMTYYQRESGTVVVFHMISGKALETIDLDGSIIKKFKEAKGMK